MDLGFYLLVILLVSFTPGPGIIFNILLALNHGLKKVFFSVSGMMSGFLFYGVASFYLMGFLNASGSLLFNVVQFAGSVYVIYMGYSKIMSHKRPNLHKEVESRANSKLFLDGLFLSVSGPKPLIFFTSILPPFIDFESNASYQFAVMTGIFLMGIFLANLFYSLAGLGVAGKVSNSEKHISRLNFGSGWFFVGLGLFLIYRNVAGLV